MDAKATELEACSMILKSTSNLGQNNKKAANPDEEKSSNSKNSEPRSSSIILWCKMW